MESRELPKIPKEIHEYITQNWGIFSGDIPANFEPLPPEVYGNDYKIYDFSSNIEPVMRLILMVRLVY